MSAKVPCTSTTGSGWAAVGAHDQSLAPGGLMPGADWAAAAAAGTASSRQTATTRARMPAPTSAACRSGDSVPPMGVRLRQAVLVARDLDAVAGELQRELGLGEAFAD